MDWEDLVDNLLESGALFSLAFILYGGWMYLTAPVKDRHNTLGANRPKTLGWRE